MTKHCFVLCVEKTKDVTVKQNKLDIKGYELYCKSLKNLSVKLIEIGVVEYELMKDDGIVSLTATGELQLYETDKKCV